MRSGKKRHSHPGRLRQGRRRPPRDRTRHLRSEMAGADGEDGLSVRSRAMLLTDVGRYAAATSDERRATSRVGRHRPQSPPQTVRNASVGDSRDARIDG